MSSPLVTAKDTRFELNGVDFPVSGINCYFLAYCTDLSRRNALAAAKAMGANTIRCWAFLAPDESPDLRLANLDALIQAADECGLKLIMPLVNYWGDFGGMPVYVRRLGTSSDVTEFYRAPALRAMYREWIHRVLTRRNTITGRLYCDEPAVMAWELTNEARCATPGGRELMLNWVQEMSAYVKERDPQHLLALGDEGFFFKKGRGHLYDGRYGMDWESILNLENMDFGTCHFYPQDWGYRSDHAAIAKKWIQDHAEVANRLKKPAILEEYGLRLPADRDKEYGRWRQLVNDSGMAGSLVWMLGHPAADTRGYVDGFVLYSGFSGEGSVRPG